MKEAVVERYLRRLEHTILNNGILEQYLEIKLLKIKLEELILSQDLGHPDVPRIQAKLLHEHEAELIEKFSIGKKNYATIIGLLNDIKKEYPNKGVDTFLTFFSYLQNNNFLDEMHSLSIKQSKALNNNKFMKFLKLYNKEKVLQYEVMSQLSKLDFHEAAQEIIRVEKRPNLNVSSSSKLSSIIGFVAIAGVISIGVFTEGNGDIESIKTWVGILATTGGFTDLVFLNKILDAKRITHRMRLYNEGIKLPEDEMKVIATLEKTYKIKIKGTARLFELEYLQEVLEMYHPIEVKKFLRAVFFRPKDKTTVQMVQVNGEQVGRYQAVYHRGNLSLDIYVPDKHSIFHELTHARIFSLPQSIYGHWKEINRKGIPPEKLKDKVEYEPRNQGVIGWKELRFQPAFGYARSYSLTDIDEDLATMADFVFDVSEGEDFKIHDRQYFDPYRHIYEQKSELLVRFGIITRHRQKKFLSWLMKHNKYPVKTHQV